MSIYFSLPPKPIKPTRLYIKEVNGVKYFGKYTGQDIESYNGSGVMWSKIVNKHGTPKTLWVSDWYFTEEIQRFALKFSRLNKIVEDTKWANLKEETGLDGGFEHINSDPQRSEKVRRIRLEYEKTEEGTKANLKRSRTLKKPKTIVKILVKQQKVLCGIRMVLLK